MDIPEQHKIDLAGNASAPAGYSPVDHLSAIDWDFHDRKSHEDIEGIHPYPAKFIPDIPRALLSVLPVQHGTAVLDPFCGSGTTMVESQRRGFDTIGIDLNPIACLISRIKTGACPIDLEGYALRAVIEADNQLKANVPAIPNLDHWFEPAIQQKLASLVSVVNSMPNEARDCLRLALSSIIVRVSKQESDTRYASVPKNISPKDVADLFLRAVARIVVALRARRYMLTSAQVIEGDTLAIKPEQIAKPIGLVITSPPYPNAYEYWLYHKYRMWWLGFDPLAVKAREIGARAHFFKKNPHTADDFAQQMEKTFLLLSRVVVSGGYVCFVIGRSRIRGQTIDNGKIVLRAGHSFGFHQTYVTERVLSPKRKAFNLAYANIKREKVLVLRNEGP